MRAKGEPTASESERKAISKKREKGEHSRAEAR
jgi:hypothetical protein